MKTEIPMKRHYRYPATACACALLLCVLTGAGKSAEEDDIRILRNTGKAFTSVAKKAMPAVVFIKIEKIVAVQQPGYHNDPYSYFGDDFLQRFFRGRMPSRRYRQMMGQGSGFLISKDGYILTNNHVVGNADRILVQLSDGREFEAKLIGTDPRSEVAVIKIEGDDFPYVELGDSASLEIGEWVIAVGNPFGLSETLTVGVVSAKGRSDMGIAEYEDFIQTDAAINPGNSGGPLLNIDGSVVGINTAIYSQSGGYMGIGFAIPINMAKAIKNQFIKNDGKMIRGYLGVTYNRQDMDEDMAKSFGLDKAEGVLVAGVIDSSPADKAKLQEGDIILAIDGRPVANNSSFRNTIAFLSPETEISLTVFRDGKKRKVKVAIGVYPDDREDAVIATELSEKIGVSVQELTRDLARRFGYEVDEGVIVSKVEPGTPAHQEGIQAGYLIMGINRRPVKSIREYEEAMAEAAKQDVVLLKIRNTDYLWYVTLRLN
jgi:serine protease Do